MEEKKLLKSLCTSHAPSGRENRLHNIIKEAFKPYGNITSGQLNNLYIHKKGKGKNSIMLMAHADEIFMLITEISERGFLKFKGFGLDAKALVSQEVIVHGKKDIEGIIGVKPPHLMNDEDRKKGVKVENLFIDTGYSTESLKDIVKVGDFVTVKRDFYELLNDKVSCKAIDDRSSITAMYCCAKELSNVNHDLDVYYVCSCQEELGHRGAKMASYDINPTMAIAIDVTFDNGPMGIVNSENKLGGGPVICIGPNIHPKFRKRIMNTAEKYNIPYNLEVEPGNTGTDAWDIQIARSGIPTLLISIPEKYMHTSVEVVDMKDIINTGRLMANFIKDLKDDEVGDLLCF